MASACVEEGHEVILVSGPVCLPQPDGVRLVKVETALEMLEAVGTHVEWCDALVMAAAVADWRPSRWHPQKLKKHDMPAELGLERNPDILSEMKHRKGRRIYVGFAAETGDVVPEARRKMHEKSLDLIVGNDVARDDSGFGTDTNKVVFLSNEGEVVEFPAMPKSAVAGEIVAWIEKNRGV